MASSALFLVPLCIYVYREGVYPNSVVIEALDCQNYSMYSEKSYLHDTTSYQPISQRQSCPFMIAKCCYFLSKCTYDEEIYWKYSIMFSFILSRTWKSLWGFLEKYKFTSKVRLCWFSNPCYHKDKSKRKITFTKSSLAILTSYQQETNKRMYSNLSSFTWHYTY